MAQGAAKLNLYSGTITNLVSGTINAATAVLNSGTINVGTVVNNGGTVDMLKAGTITTLPNLPGGTLTNLISGTINAATAILDSGTINVGTVMGPDADGVGTTGNPILIAGRFNGTAKTLITDTSSRLVVVPQLGTLTLVSTVSNLSAGSVNVVAGTIATLGTMGTLGLINTVTTLSNLTNGSINVTAGTIATLGTMGTLGLVNTVTTLSNLSAGSVRVIAGTVGGAAATAVALSGNPIPVGGVDSGGTMYGLLVDAKGQQLLGGGTIDMLKAGTISSLPNLPQGSINVTAGTIATLGTMGTLGLVNTITTLSNLSAGSVNVIAGTIATLGTMGTLGLVNTVTTVSNITNGSIVQTAGTVNIGTIVGKDANAAAQTGNPLAFGGTDSGGTMRTVTVDSAGRLTVNSVAAGTTIGTISVGTINTGTINAGTVTIGDGSRNVVVLTNPSDAQTNSNAALVVSAESSGFNGLAWDRLKTGTAATNTTGLGVLGVAAMGQDNGGTQHILAVTTGGSLGTLQVIPQGGTIQNLNYGTIALSDGTTKASIMASGVSNGTAAQNAQIVAGAFAESSWSLTGPGTVVSTDVGNFKWVSVHIVQQYTTSTTSFQISNDNTNWTSVYLSRTDNATSGGATSQTSASLIYQGPLSARYFRIAVTGAYSSGTCSGVVEFFSHPGVLNNMAVQQSGAWNVTGTIANGSIAVTTGTITAGTLTNLTSGTINAATAVLNSGTINVGTFVMPSGTLTVLPNLPQGSINVTAGTIRDDGRAARNIVSYGTQFGASGASAATIVGSASVGAGTSTWVQDFSILNPNGSVLVTLGFGTAQQGTNVLFRGVLGTQTGIGIEKSYAKAVNAGMTNQDLVLSLGAAGTVDLATSYFISA